MKLGIMQPYFFPYIGYFQLINAVDKFLIYDDVNFIKGGWINRNRILLKGSAFMINIPMSGASSFKNINDISIGKNKEKLLSTVQQSYRKAPFYNEIFPVINDVIKYDSVNLAYFIFNSILRINDYLKIDTKLILSSEIKKDDKLKAQEKIISICKTMGASEYYNAIGGQELYSKEKFTENGLILKFIKSKPIIYSQFKNEFIPWLSIIDVMMFNPLDRIQEMLGNYDLV